MLDLDIKNQLSEYMKLLENEIVITTSLDDSDSSKEMKEFIEDVASLSSSIKVEEGSLERTPSFSIRKSGDTDRVIFSAIPMGHEFTSFVLALLQVSGREPKEEARLLDIAKNLKGEYNFTTYVSLSCQNCPIVVQALNLISAINPNVKHTMVDGSLFTEEVESKNILNVPSTYLNGEIFHNGRIELEEILQKLSDEDISKKLEFDEPFDSLVIGGGPAGASAAIYSARKGIKTAILVERFGGQLNDTVGIENYIGVEHIEGQVLSGNLEKHIKSYDIEVIMSKRAKDIRRVENLVEVELESGEILKSKTVIIATGAKWRKVGVKGEDEFLKKGVAFCPHCDGPLFKGKNVAVIGGGNSGIEAAIDLAGITDHVSVLEFLPELKADSVLQKKLYSLNNVDVYKNVATKEITGDTKVNGITFENRESGEIKHLDLSGVFVQIGLLPNTDWIGDRVERNKIGEILVDKRGATSMEGVFAAGDCTDSAYKQIIISMGSGATAALSAFDYLIRNK